MKPNVFACVLACLLALPACVVDGGGPEHVMEHTSRVVAPSHISGIAIETRSADVVLEATTAKQIAVRTYVAGNRPYTSEHPVEIGREGSTLIVSWLWTGFTWCLGMCETRLEIDYPASLPVGVITSSGDVRAEAARGPLGIHTSSGDVRIFQAARDLRVHTSSGDVTATLASGWHGRGIVIETSSGDVRLTVPNGFRGMLMTESDSGDVHDDTHMTGSIPVKITTGSGDINVFGQ